MTAWNKKRKIVTPSMHSEKEIRKYYGVSEDRLSVVCDGWEHMSDIKADESILDKLPQIKGKEFFFSLGSRYKHKNYAWVIKAAIKNPQYCFVVTGSDSYSSEIDNLKNTKPDNIIYTGYISDGEIKALYQKCKALIQPSLYEGFGIPPLEALSVGGKAIVSNTSCLPERSGDSVYYLDPYSDGADLDELMKAKVGVSRPLIDMGWAEYPHQGGQTGASVAPKLLISLGVSGAVQHLAGINGAQTVIAVNTDESAPILKRADYTILKDCVAFTEEMISELKK